jgi:hypothetical protein
VINGFGSKQDRSDSGPHPALSRNRERAK